MIDDADFDATLDLLAPDPVNQALLRLVLTGELVVFDDHDGEERLCAAGDAPADAVPLPPLAVLARHLRRVADAIEEEES